MSVPGMQERTILLDGFSKTYAMTGWRIGYGVMRADLAAQIARLVTNCNSCTAAFTQRAALAALAGDQSAVDAMRAEFERRSRAFVDGLNRIKGFSARMPKGAFYIFANITATGWPSKRLADALLEQAGVAALSGTAFGSFGEGYLRFSVASSMENLMEALQRIDAWTKANL
jgi:aspartate/methionine/tyrosine aminotransferase